MGLSYATSLFSTILVLLIILRSIINLINLFSNIRWLKKNSKLEITKANNYREKFLICIPMLREQKVVEETLNYFARLNYPKSQYKIIVVTTSKEIYQKNINKKRLVDLSQSLYKKEGLACIKEKYAGLFPFDILESIHGSSKLLGEKMIAKLVASEFESLKSTYTIAHNIAEKINKKIYSNLINVFNYQNNQGEMSHQINYVIRKLNKDKQYGNYIFAVYNADSRPSPDTLQFVSTAINQYALAYSFRPNIVQQSSLFTLNYDKYSKSIIGYILKAAALLQTKWTLIWELSRFRDQSRNVVGSNKNLVSTFLKTRISHCVGHGLFVRFDNLCKQYLPTETINEDLPFGYYQCCKGEPILPLPILENSESPDTVTGLINQKRFWFTPYLEYLKCRNRVLKLGKYRSRLEVEILTWQAELAGLIWLFQSSVIFIPPIVALTLHNFNLFAFWLVSILMYWFIPIAIIYKNLHSLEKLAGKIVTHRSISDYLLTSFFGLFVLLTHSLGPIISVKDFVFRLIFNKDIKKIKTER